MLRVRLVGELRIDVGGQSLGPIASSRARSLLAWLAYHPGLHPRSRVAAVFWPEVLESSSRASLRTTLATLRRELGEAERHVDAGRQRLGIPDGPEVWVDLREAGRLAAEGRLEEALALADGELLSDLDDDWVLEERRIHRDRVVELLAAAERAGDHEAALLHARRRLELDPASEEAARVLMRRLATGGDRAAAAAVYEELRAALRRDLGMAPSAETRALLEELRTGQTDRRPAPLPDALARTEHGPLVGRREALAALRAAWRRASAGAATVVVVAGEAGSGKTRLLTELGREIHGAGATVLAGRCVEDGGVAFAPFTEALRPYAASAALPDWVIAELARLLPELGLQAQAPEGRPQDARHRLFEAVAAAIGHAARGGPVLLVVEDLHWADPATVQMLAHVIRTVGWAPLLVAGSLRAEDGRALHALLGDLRRERRLERVDLTGLSENDVGRLAREWLQEPPSPELVAAVRRRTGGNPLFVEELVRHLLESRAADPVAAATTELPPGVHAVIERRLAQLPESAARAVDIAAVAGEDFALAEIATVSEARDDAVADALEVAVAAGLVDEAAVPGQYRFAHALVRESVLAGLSATRRALLHRRHAAALEAQPGRAGEVARHLLEARPLVDAATAARAALRAAEEATQRLAYEDAAELLERAGDPEADERLRAEVLLALGDARQRSGDAASADRCFVAAAAEARALGDGELLARAALGVAGLTVTVGPVRYEVRALLQEALAAVQQDSPLRPRLLSRLAIESYYAHSTTVREDLSDEALAAGRRLGGRALLEALGARHVALWSPAHSHERLRIADELVSAARAEGDREAELQGVNWRVTDLVELGALADAQSAIEEHERLAGELRLLGFAWYVPMWRAMLALMAGRLDEARRFSEEGERIGHAARDRNAAVLFQVQRLAVRYAAGTLTDADVAEIEETARRSPAGAAWRLWATAIALLGGEHERARRMILAEAEALDSLPLDANWLYSATALGIQLAHLGETETAAAVYPRVLPYRHLTVTSGRASACGGSVALSLGLVAAALDDHDAAVSHLDEAARRNDELGAVPYAVAARRALSALSDEADRAAAVRREAGLAMRPHGLPAHV
jgi:DNA-binding SARP family transcriptional activator